MSATSLCSLTLAAVDSSFALAIALITEECGALAGTGAGGLTAIGTGTGAGTGTGVGTLTGTGYGAPL